MKDTILFSVCAGVSLVMFLIVFFAIRNGRVGTDGSTAPYSLRSCPGKFVAVVFSYFVIGCAFLAFAISFGVKIWGEL
jgi:hypothetical protein